jgi:predicted PurR-regulated permease PerM
MSDWLRVHGQEAQHWGQEAGHSIIQLIMGMIIGGIIAIQDSRVVLPPFARALQERASHLQLAFQRIVFAQVRISAINAGLSAIYLLVVLPASDVHLPLAKTLVLLTFVFGLLPVVGNVISNTVLVIVSLSHSLQIACFSLCYMIVIHKLEYFLNAKIIGTQINAKAWELLIAILVMEAVFGIPGLVAAPVFYACLKIELGMGCKPAA